MRLTLMRVLLGQDIQVGAVQRHPEPHHAGFPGPVVRVEERSNQLRVALVTALDRHIAHVKTLNKLNRLKL